MKSLLDILDIIRENTLEYENKDDKDYFREVFNDTFVSLVDFSINKINEIDKRVENSLNDIRILNPVYSALMSKTEFKLYDDDFTPLFMSDLAEDRQRYSYYMEKINGREKFTMKSVPILFNTKEEQKIAENKLFKGILCTDEGLTGFVFKIKKSRKYQELIEKMYKVVRSNRMKWTTQNIPYLNVMYDIVVESYDDPEMEYIREIYDINYNFGNIEKYIMEDYILVWNVERRKIGTVNFPRPLPDKILYQHKLDYHARYNVLVENKNEDMLLVYYDRRSQVNVFSKSKDEGIWVIWNIVRLDKQKYTGLKYKVYSNEKYESVIEKLNKQDHLIRTMAEMQRIINSYVDLAPLKLLEIYPKRIAADYVETNNLNFFIEDEFLFDEEINKILTLRFKILDRNEIFITELTDFIVSELENIYKGFKYKVVLE